MIWGGKNRDQKLGGKGEYQTHDSRRKIRGRKGTRPAKAMGAGLQSHQENSLSREKAAQVGTKEVIIGHRLLRGEKTRRLSKEMLLKEDGELRINTNAKGGDTAASGGSRILNTRLHG